jgi:hypothetical protein
MEGGLQFRCRHCEEMVDDLSEHHCPESDLARLAELEGFVPGPAPIGSGTEAREGVAAPAPQACWEAGVKSVASAPGGKFDKRGYQRAYMRQRRLKGGG